MEHTIITNSEQIFHNTVREYIIWTLLFLIFYIGSYALVKWLVKEIECDVQYAGREDAFVFRISIWICTFTVAVSCEAVLLLPISVLANEFLHTFPDSYYLQWVNTSLIQGLWRQISIMSNCCLFTLLPFAYFFHESEGVSGSPNRISSRIYETILVFSLVSAVVCGITWVAISMWSNVQNYALFYDLWNFYVPYLYSSISLLGSVIFLLCTPYGFLCMFSNFGDIVKRPRYLVEAEELLHVSTMELHSLQRHLSRDSSYSSNYNRQSPNQPPHFTPTTHLPTSRCSPHVSRSPRPHTHRPDDLFTPEDHPRPSRNPVGTTCNRKACSAGDASSSSLASSSEDLEQLLERRQPVELREVVLGFEEMSHRSDKLAEYSSKFKWQHTKKSKSLHDRSRLPDLVPDPVYIPDIGEEPAICMDSLSSSSSSSSSSSFCYSSSSSSSSSSCSNKVPKPFEPASSISLKAPKNFLAPLKPSQPSYDRDESPSTPGEVRNSIHLVKDKISHYEHQLNSGAFRRNVFYPLTMIMLAILTLACLLIVFKNSVMLLLGLRQTLTNEENQEMILGLASLSIMGPIGAVIEVTLILYMMFSCVLGLYNVPLFKKIKPKPSNTPIIEVMYNSALILIISSALPLQSRILGLTDFDLRGNYGTLDWVRNNYIVFAYNCVFASFTAVCLANKFTSKIRSSIYNRLYHALWKRKNSFNAANKEH